jgi:adenylate cyclase
MERITVVLADDNLIVRAGVAALLSRDSGIEIIGEAGDLDSLIEVAERLAPQVIVTDIRMPPAYNNEGIEGAKLIRKRNPGTGIVILSQYDEPEYAIGLLAEGAAGYAYLLKERVGDGGQLSRAIREVAAGGSMLDPEIVAALVAPAKDATGLTADQRRLLQLVGEGKPVKAIAATLHEPAGAVDQAIQELFMVLGKDAGAGGAQSLRLLRSLHTAILQREEQGETLSRLLPSKLAAKLRSDRTASARTERLTVTVLMSDVRGYSGIAEHTDPGVLAQQLNDHRREMNAAVLGEDGTVMQYVGDAVMAVFGAPDPQPDHAARAIRTAMQMHERQRRLDETWAADGLESFGLGIGLSTGAVAAALLGSDERVEYTLVGDVVNLSQRLQDLARPAGTTVASRPTVKAGGEKWHWESLGDHLVKGRETPVPAYRLLDLAGVEFVHPQPEEIAS